MEGTMTTGAARTLTLGITGMTCGSCQRRVEDALRALPGVDRVVVDLEPGTAEVRYDPATTSPAAVAAAVRRAGYGLDIPGRSGPTPRGCGCGCGH